MTTATTAQAGPDVCPDYNAKNPAPGVRVYGVPYRVMPKLSMMQMNAWRKSGEAPLGIKNTEIKPGPRRRKAKSGTRSLCHLCGPSFVVDKSVFVHELKVECARLIKWHRKYILTGKCHKHEWLTMKQRFANKCGLKHRDLFVTLP